MKCEGPQWRRCLPLLPQPKALNNADDVRRWGIINIIAGALSILLTGYEIFRMATESLTPKTLLMTNTMKLFGIILGMIMDGMATGTSLNEWADGTFVIHALLV